MGNTNSFDGSICSCISPEEDCTLDDNTLISTGKKNKHQPTLQAHAKFLQKGRTYSLSSMSGSSSNASEEGRDERTRAKLRSTKPSIFDAEMRNDSEHCQNMSEDELRVTQSSYDEATTEALSQYYSNRAAYDGRVKRVGIRNNLEREVRE
uniref:Uncharacterized protein n=1 Tax=Chaetoceros debilis TaxID=122233 RepID=A0A7S3PWL7_9STRA|mmetsp:Transcript_4713/g.6916  ORF Transcript_4713/g.6916 Transcript_4713/m.6916 type:complete len:151 (-) Transcript_4713:46-498(-)|eukprot:CAMPEP_0194095260 /NCGR_PEP_ID=MMETSP0149-20130528/56737_1 /TAXON_ID=122233 /ORGANISM="Chaetoceros debilis, Strain MM31A-1" /LENGTH=150 /DNA_ID=CAMNT_0038781201 /DNA_START=506 /DNA_END=958 /DNA_ORIENTATION=-